MNLSLIFHSLVVMVFLGLAGMGHPGNGDSLDPIDNSSINMFIEAHMLGEATSIRGAVCVELRTPQELTVARVCLSNTSDSLIVHFQAEEGWVFSETQLAVAATLEGIPKIGPGIPALGQFAYKSAHTSASTEQDYSVALESLNVSPGSEIIVAAHVSVINAAKEEEGAWGRGERFVEDGNPATYFSYMLDQNGG